MRQIYVGTSSWSFEDWRGVFYPERLPANRFLRTYAGHFNTVEVNTSFYGLPAPATVISWVDQTPAGFVFALKFPREISHDRRLSGCEQTTLAFLDVLRSLGPSAGPGLLQLPSSFTRAELGRPLAVYLDWLASQMEGLSIAVEVRAQDLMTGSFAQFVAERGIALVLSVRSGQPDLYPYWMNLLDHVAGPQFAYVRFIGDDRTPLPDNREVRRPQDEQLDLWSDRILHLLRAEKSVYAYFHNPYEGHSPASVRRLCRRIAHQHPLMPWPPSDFVAPPMQMALFPDK